MTTVYGFEKYPDHPLTMKALYSCQTWMWSKGYKDTAKLGLKLFEEIWGHHPLIDKLIQ